MFDEDVKIAGDKYTGASAPASAEEYRRQSENGNIDNAKKMGAKIAEKIVKTAAVPWGDQQDDSFDLQLQRGLLLTFAATITVESLPASELIKDIIKQAFFNELSRLDSGLYKGTVDSGAFSFYYLAYRRGIDIERRIGQTFAMLCSHDGDPVYQELGEALFCSMRSKTLKAVENY